MKILNYKEKNKYNSLLIEGFKKFEDKKFNEAKAIFEKILSSDSNNLKANHAMGVLYGILDNHSLAIEYLKKTLKIEKNYLPSLKNLAYSYAKTNSNEDAIEIFQQLLIVDSKNSGNYLNDIGNCYYNQSKDDIAEDFFLKSLGFDNNQFKPYLNLGILKKKAKDFKSSLEYFSKAKSIDENEPLLLKHMADLFYKTEDFDNSILFLKKYLDHESEDTDVLFVLACSYFGLEDHHSGSDIMNKLISMTKSDKEKETYYQKACAAILNINNYDTDKEYSYVFLYSNLALNINPQNYAAYSYRAIAKFYQNDNKGAIQDAEKAIKIKPIAEITLGNLSNFYKYIGEYKKAEETLNKYFIHFPENRKQDFLYASASLCQMKFRQGWEYYESRWKVERGAVREKLKPPFEKPEWRPELGFNSILVWAEQGLGDQILHGNMLYDFSKKFKKTYLAIDPRLLEIFQKSFPDIHCYSLFDETNQEFFDYQIPLTSIGAYVRESVEDFFPLRSPFLNFHKKLEYDKKRKLRCAISWKSSQGTHSKLKSMSLNDLSKILKLSQIEFYNIQYTDEREEIEQAQKDHGFHLLDPPGLDVKNDLVGLIDFFNNCDFIINISNTNAHLSGAIGKKTYLLLPTPAGRFWYWENNYNGKNIWYPSIEIFTQKEPYNWSDPIDELLKKIKTDFSIENFYE